MSESAWDYGRSLPPYRWNELPDFNGGAFPAPIRLKPGSATSNPKRGAIKTCYLDDDAVIAAMTGFFFENLHFEVEIDKAKDAGHVEIGTEKYKLAKLHFHMPAEHTLDGKLSRMEVHLVHTDPKSVGVVVGIMVEELTPALEAAGNTASPLLEFFYKQLPKVTLPHTEIKGMTKAPKAHSLKDGFPAKKSYFWYQGGLTTPPCSEPVFFHILDTPIYTTSKIIDKFAGYVPGGNNRPLQPDNGRPVEYFPG